MSAAGGTVALDGDVWRILGVGSFLDGRVYCHLASTTAATEQRNGANPRQISDWLDAAVVEHALDRPRGFYSWNRSLRGVFENGERAAGAGVSIDACPYRDHRKSTGGLTWSRAYRSAWRDGYNYAAVRLEVS